MKRMPDSKTYLVRLHFAETKFDAPGQRVFNVDINGKPALHDFDILKEAGGKNKAMVREVAGILPDASNRVIIQFRKGGADEAKVNAIEIIPSHEQ